MCRQNKILIFIFASLYTFFLLQFYYCFSRYIVVSTTSTVGASQFCDIYRYFTFSTVIRFWVEWWVFWLGKHRNSCIGTNYDLYFLCLSFYRISLKTMLYFKNVRLYVYVYGCRYLQFLKYFNFFKGIYYLYSNNCNLIFNFFLVLFFYVCT